MMSRYHVPALAVLSSIILITSAFGEVKSKSTLIAENADFVELGGTKSYFGATPDNTRIFCENYEDDGAVLYVDGKKIAGSLARDWEYPFSPDGKRTAAVCVEDENEEFKQYVLTDGEKGKRYDSVEQVAFSANSEHLVYIARRDDKSVIVVDGKEKGTYSEVLWDQFWLSPDGKRVAFGVKVGDKWAMAVNGKKGKSYNGLDNVAFSPDSKRLAYVGEFGREESVVVDGAEHKPCDLVAIGPFFSPDSKRLAYVAKYGERHAVVVDGKQQTLYQTVSQPEFSPDGKRLAYMASEGNKGFLVVEGVEQTKYDRVIRYAFSPDGRRIAYVARKEGESFVVLDRKEQKRYDSIEIYSNPLQFNPDSKRFAYVAESADKQSVVADGKEQKQYDRIEQLMFTPDSKRVAYIAKEGGKQFVVIDRKEEKRYSSVELLTFGPDGKHFAYSAYDGEDWRDRFVVLDGKELRDDGSIIQDRSRNVRIVFDGPNKLHFLAQKGKDIYLVEKEIE